MYVYVKVGVSQQYNIYTKTAIFLWKSSGFTYLGLAVALATWYNKKKDNLVIIITFGIVGGRFLWGGAMHGYISGNWWSEKGIVDYWICSRLMIK